jgi:hypothetical protein
LGTPALTLADTLKEVRGVLFLGNTTNSLAIYDLTIGGYTPPCL